MIGLGVTLLLAIGGALGRAASLQVSHHLELEREASLNYAGSVDLDGWRGDIVDRHGALLATTVHRWAVTADPQRVEEIGATASALAPLLEQDRMSLETKLAPTWEGPSVQGTDNPAARAARAAVQPWAELVADAFGFRVSRFDRPLSLLEYFYQMEQLRRPEVLAYVQTLDGLADTVSEVIHADSDSLRFFPYRGRRFAYLARDLDDGVARRINDERDRLSAQCREAGTGCSNPLGAIRVVPEPKRYNPLRGVATQVVGRVGPQGEGQNGIERSVDGILAGKLESTKSVRDRRGRAMLLGGVPEGAALSAPTVELAIDAQLQAHAELVLSEACEVAGARAGYAIVMHVKTGEVLAAAHYPTYNPNRHGDFYAEREPLQNRLLAFGQSQDDIRWAAEWGLNKRAFPGQAEVASGEARQALERELDAFLEEAHAHPDASRSSAFLDVYEPGSVMKVFTIAAGLDAGVVTLDRVWDLEDGLLELRDPEDNKIGDSHPMKEGTVAEIMKISSNIGAAKIGFDLGPERLERYLHDFGFGEPTGSGFPGEAPGLLLPSAEWPLVNLANIAFGQGIAATGIQLAAALSAIGNEGKLLRPILIRRVLSPDGEELRRWEPEVVRQVLSPKAARTTLDLMRLVVEPGGTGERAHIPEYPVAGKTGTGQKSHLRKRGYAEDMWVATFLGVAPADDPELAEVILIDEPKGKRHSGGAFAAPPFKRIMSHALRHLGVPSPFENGREMAWLDPAKLAERRALTKAEETDTTHLLPPVSPGRADQVVVPDLVGLTMDEVRRLAHTSSIGIAYQGTGIAYEHDPPAHARVEPWSTVEVRLRPRSPDVPRIAPNAPDAVAEVPGLIPLDRSLQEGAP
jgi:cell division protein FtsI/penicillin-binding protein 2